MKVFEHSIADGTLSHEEATEVTNWIISKVEWFDTRSTQFKCLKSLESFMFSRISSNKSDLDLFIDLLAKNIVPADLHPRNVDESIQASSRIFIGGREFLSEKEIIEYIQNSIIKKYHPLKQSKEAVVISDENHRRFLLELFKHHPSAHKADNISKILYGPSIQNSGATWCFQIKKLMEESDSVKSEKWERDPFVRPHPRTVITEDVSYIKCASNIFLNVIYSQHLRSITTTNARFAAEMLRLMETTMTMFPLSSKKILERLVARMFHHRMDKILIVTQIHNLLLLARRFPRIEFPIVKMVMEKILKIDAEAYNFALKSKTDDLIQLVMIYITARLDGKMEEDILPPYFQNFFDEVAKTTPMKGWTQSSNKRFVEEMMEFFALRIMKVERPMYIQFIYFHLCTFNNKYPWIKEAFLEMLILNITDKTLQRQVKLNSFYYLFSFIMSSNFNSEIILYTSIDYLLESCHDFYEQYLKRNPCLKSIIEKDLPEQEFQNMLSNRRTETENINSIGDDIFIYCLQGMLFLLAENYSNLGSIKKKALMKSFDHFFKDKIPFVKFSHAESGIFEDLYGRLAVIIPDEHSTSVNMIRDCVTSEINSRTSKASRSSPPKSKAIVKGIDYFPFEPVESRFFDLFISPYFDWGQSASSFFSDKESPFESLNFSQMETSTGTINNNIKGLSSPDLNKRGLSGSMTPPICTKLLKF